MLKILIKAKLLGTIHAVTNRNRSKNKEKGKKGAALLFVFILVYIAATFGLLFGTMFYSAAMGLKGMDLDWLFFALVGLMSFSLAFIGSVFTTKSQLFEAKDNEFLLSMPIAPSAILGSRMVLLFLLNFAMVILVTVAAGVGWTMVHHFEPVRMLMLAVTSIAVTLLSMSLSCAIAWLLSQITSRMKKNALLTTALYFVFLGAYFFVIFNLNNYLVVLLENGEQIAAAIRSTFYPAYVMGVAVAETDIVQLLIFVAVCALPFVVVYALLSRSFIGIVTSKRGATRVQYKRSDIKKRSVSRALLGRELRHFGGNSVYILNSALGSVATIVAGIALIIYRDSVLPLAEMVGTDITFGAAAAILFFLTLMDYVSAPSVSLEGKSLWIVRTMPVETSKVLMAKVYMHVFVVLPPALITVGCFVYVFSFGVVQTLCLLLFVTVTAVFGGFFGVVTNVNFPRLDFVNEATVVKNSASVIICAFGGLAFGLVPIALYIFIFRDMLTAGVYVWIVTAFIAVVSLLLKLYLSGKGAEKFEELAC